MLRLKHNGIAALRVEWANDKKQVLCGWLLWTLTLPFIGFMAVLLRNDYGDIANLIGGLSALFLIGFVFKLLKEFDWRVVIIDREHVRIQSWSRVIILDKEKVEKIIVLDTPDPSYIQVVIVMATFQRSVTTRQISDIEGKFRGWNYVIERKPGGDTKTGAPIN